MMMRSGNRFKRSLKRSTYHASRMPEDNARQKMPSCCRAGCRCSWSKVGFLQGCCYCDFTSTSMSPTTNTTTTTSTTTSTSTSTTTTTTTRVGHGALLCLGVYPACQKQYCRIQISAGVSNRVKFFENCSGPPTRFGRSPKSIFFGRKKFR